MDAKSKANFINSVASGANVPCPKCGASNKADRKFCVSCGAEITASQTTANDTPAFASTQEAIAPAKTSRYVESNNVFAQGLPAWNIEPPQVMVRRR